MRLKRLFTSFIAMLLLVFSQTGCSFNEKVGDEVPKITINRMEYGIVDDPIKGIENAIPGTAALKAGNEYYLLIDVNYAPNFDSNGKLIISSELTLFNVDVIDGFLEEANTGEASQLNFRSDDDHEAQISTFDFKIPANADSERSMMIKVRIVPNFKTNTSAKQYCQIRLNVRCEKERNNKDIEIIDEKGNGRAFAISVEKAKIDEPVISYTEEDGLSWTAVSNAYAYEVLVKGQVLKTFAPANIYDAEYAQAGTTIYYQNIASDIIKAYSQHSSYSVQVRAIGPTTNYNYIPGLSNVISVSC